MNIHDKQNALTDFLHNIDDTVLLEFNMSKKFKTTTGTAFYATHKIMITSVCFKFTLDSMKHCILHEFAHLMQYKISGYSAHNKEFGDIKDMLIKDYGTPEIAASNKSTKKAWSMYIYDSEQ